MGKLFSHIKTAFINYADSLPNQTWLGQHYDLMIGAGGWGWPWIAPDMSTARVANESLLLFVYMGLGSIRPSSALWPRLLQWLSDNPGKSYENFFYHYKYDHSFSSSYGVPVIGYATGSIPGYPSGGALNQLHTRMPAHYAGSAYNSSKNITSISRSTNVVTVQTSTAHGFVVGDRVYVSGVTDPSFNGYGDITEITDSTHFKYLQNGSDGSSSGGTTAIRQTDYLWANLTANEFRDLIIDCLTLAMTPVAGGERGEWLKDFGGNYWNGLYCDTALLPEIHQYDAPLVEWAKVQECIDSGQSGSDALISAWIFDTQHTWYHAVRDAVQAYLTPKGKSAYTCANALGLQYAGITRQNPFWQTDAVDIGLIEDAFNPAQMRWPTTIIPRIKQCWEQMNNYGRKFIYQGFSKATVDPTDFDGGTIAWTQYSANIWYTTAFNSNCSQGIAGVVTPVSTNYWDANVHGIGDLTSGKLWYDSATGRTYIYATSDPNTSTPGAVLLYGHDKVRMFELASYYIYAHCPNSYFFHLDIGMGPYNKIPQDNWTWFEAIAEDFGIPTIGGVKFDGTLGTDLWGESCSTSDKAFEAWRDTVDSNDRIYARKFTRGYMIHRWMTSFPDRPGRNQLTWTLPFRFNVILQDGTMGSLTDQLTLAKGEGAILSPGKRILFRR